MLRHRLFTLALTTSAMLWTPDRAAAQCAPFRPACGGAYIGCATPPVIGTSLRISLGPSCNTTNNLLLIGACHGPGLPLGNPPLCAFCSSCRLHVLPSLTIPWIGSSGSSVGLPIPSNPALVGAVFCVQNACILPAPSSCLCLSNTLRVTIM